MRNQSSTSKELGQSNSIRSGEAYSQNSSFIVLPNGSIKRKRAKTLYKDIYLEQHLYRSTHKSQTHAQSSSYSKYPNHQGKSESFDLMSFAFDDKAKANVASPFISDKIEGTPQRKDASLHSYTSYEEMERQKSGKKQSVKERGKITMFDIIGLGSPAQPSEGKEVKESRHLHLADIVNSNDAFNGVVTQSNGKQGLINENNVKDERKESHSNPNDEINQAKGKRASNDNSNGEDCNRLEEEENHFSVHERESHPNDSANKDSDAKSNRYGLVGSESEKNELNDSNDNDNNEDEDDKGLEECHQAQLSNEDIDLINKQKLKAYHQINEIVIEESEDLLNSQKYSNTTNKLLISKSYNANNNDQLFLDNRMSIEELNSINEDNGLKISKMLRHNHDKQNQFNLNELKPTTFSIEIPSSTSNVMGKQNKGESHFHIQILNDGKRRFQGMAIANTALSLNYSFNGKHIEFGLKGKKDWRIQKVSNFLIDNVRSHSAAFSNGLWSNDEEKAKKSEIKQEANRVYGPTENNLEINCKNSNRLWIQPKAVPIINLADLIIPESCIQKQNVINVNKPKESSLEVDDIITQIKDKKRATNSIKKCAKDKAQHKPQFLLLNDSPLKQQEPLLITRPESSGNIANTKNKNIVNAIENPMASEKLPQSSHDNQYLVLNKINHEVNHLNDVNHKQLLDKASKAQTKQSKSNKFNPKKQFIMPVNSLETILVQREKQYLPSNH